MMNFMEGKEKGKDLNMEDGKNNKSKRNGIGEISEYYLKRGIFIRFDRKYIRKKKKFNLND